MLIFQTGYPCRTAATPRWPNSLPVSSPIMTAAAIPMWVRQTLKWPCLILPSPIFAVNGCVTPLTPQVLQVFLLILSSHRQPAFCLHEIPPPPPAPGQGPLVRINISTRSMTMIPRAKRLEVQGQKNLLNRLNPRHAYLCVPLWHRTVGETRRDRKKRSYCESFPPIETTSSPIQDHMRSVPSP